MNILFKKKDQGSKHNFVYNFGPNKQFTLNNILYIYELGVGPFNHVFDLGP